MVVFLAAIVGVSCSHAQPSLTVDEAHKIITTWLATKDPEGFNRCKVFLNKEDSFYKWEKEKGLIKITFMICGNMTTFWINEKTKAVECFVKYCGKNNIGKEYCGEDIPQDACNYN